MLECFQQNTPSPEPEMTAEKYCGHLREMVEKGLQENFASLSSNKLRHFAGKLSTDPAKVHGDINEGSLSFRCGEFSGELRDCLSRLGFSTNVYGSTYYEDKSYHAYLKPTNAPFDVIIDPTIGQYLIGFNHVFVGTRQQLRNLVLTQNENGTPYALRSLGKRNPELFFNIIWGISSKPYNYFTGRVGKKTVPCEYQDHLQLTGGYNRQRVIKGYFTEKAFFSSKLITPDMREKK